LREKKEEREHQKKIQDDLNAIKNRQAASTIAKPSFPATNRIPFSLPVTSSAFGLPRTTNAPASAAQPNLNLANNQQRPSRTDAQKWEMIQTFPRPLPNTPPNWVLYQSQVAQWHTTHPNAVAATEDRPYPLQPGTEPLGSGECSDCGQKGHQASACAAPQKLRDLEIRWRRKVTSIKSAVMRTGGNSPAAINLVGDSTPANLDVEYLARVFQQLQPQIEAMMQAGLFSQQNQGNGAGSSD
ncbi:hypothetical protein H0H81_007821, partial [Sphagnurus paluster]